VKITSKETPHGRSHEMVRGRICPNVKMDMLKGPKIADIDYQINDG